MPENQRYYDQTRHDLVHYPRVLLCLAANVVENTEVGTGLGCRSSLQKERTACIRSSGTGSIVFACTQHSSAHQ